MEKTIGFLFFKDMEELDFAGPWEIFGIWQKQFNGPRLITVSEIAGEVICAKGLKTSADFNFENCPDLDILLVPGGWGTRSQVNNPKLIDFIRKRSERCEYVLSVCTGALLLQKAELLDNKKATTHWSSLDKLREFKLTTVSEERFVHDGKIWTSAGISAGIDMALAFVTHYVGEELAGKIQFQVEYYPADIRYGKLDQSKDAPGYLKN